jgi:hypothetical protein
MPTMRILHATLNKAPLLHYIWSFAPRSKPKHANGAIHLPYATSFNSMRAFNGFSYFCSNWACKPSKIAALQCVLCNAKRNN